MILISIIFIVRW